MEMSSTRSDFSIHFPTESCTSSAAASRGSPAATARSQQNSDPKTSVTPSLARTSTRSSALRLSACTSGSATMPTLCASLSPRERVKAQPGRCLSLAHTRGTPSAPSCSSPWSSFLVRTRAPQSFTRLSSSARDGSWSEVNTLASSRPFLSDPSMQRESPTWDIQHWLPSNSAETAVVPESVCRPASFQSVSAARMCAAWRASVAGLPSARDWASCRGTTSAARREHFSPSGPWPSRTPMRWRWG
mmetsp:Transcript_110312/g.329857  ORF Transcript_110312/g.329857 Transcript_110312/m.329857 type:complete len:245 (-) Transcript_110312:8-742(-)